MDTCIALRMDTRKFKVVVLVRMGSGRRACRIRLNALKVATLFRAVPWPSQPQHYIQCIKRKLPSQPFQLVCGVNRKVN